MRLSVPVVTAGLSAAAAAVLLTGCGGSGQPSAAASGPAAPAGTVRPSQATPDAGTAAWCQSAAALSSDLQSTLAAAGNAPTQVAPILQKAADRYADVTSPTEITGDWGVVVGAVQTLATAARTIDFSSADAGDRLAASIRDEQDALTAATTHVQRYAQTNCPAAPSPAPPS